LLEVYELSHCRHLCDFCSYWSSLEGYERLTEPLPQMISCPMKLWCRLHKEQDFPKDKELLIFGNKLSCLSYSAFLITSSLKCLFERSTSKTVVYSFSQMRAISYNRLLSDVRADYTPQIKSILVLKFVNNVMSVLALSILM